VRSVPSELGNQVREPVTRYPSAETEEIAVVRY